MSCDKLLSRSFEEDEEEGDGEVELSLGLSLNGRFGVDPAQSRKITKSASIANFILSDGCSPLLPPSQRTSVNLLRTCSLPVENEEERRRKKDMQTLRRMEAKRKRSEKQHQLKCSKLAEEDVNGVLVKPSSQGSIGSQGSGSSGLSESDSLLNDEFERKPTVTQGQVHPRRGESTATISALEAMPHVSTRGLGPNGRRIEGLLYQYRKGEEVRIVCVCHGSFHTPSEFVRHAGGGDVTHPLRHIVVDPNPNQLL